MDEKTEELRDIFMDVAEAETVTETQEETPGSLASEEDVERRLADAVTEMRSDLDFRTAFDDEGLVTVVRGFYADEDDAAIAADLPDGIDADDVARARLDLHLVTAEDETLDLDALRDADEASDAALATALDVDEETVRWHRRLLETREERRRVNDRYRDEFESILQDRDLVERMTETVQQDGLEDATDGMETELQL